MKNVQLLYLPTTEQNYEELPKQLTLRWWNGLLWSKLVNEPTQERGQHQSNTDTGFQSKPWHLRSWRGVIKYLMENYRGFERGATVGFRCCDTTYFSNDGAQCHVRRHHGITVRKENKNCLVGFNFQTNPRFVTFRVEKK